MDFSRQIIIFDAAEQQIYPFTEIELPEVFLLCLMDRDHFDVVYKKEQIDSAGFCQCKLNFIIKLSQN